MRNWRLIMQKVEPTAEKHKFPEVITSKWQQQCKRVNYAEN